jgi:SAM-dependent methyltransferase
MNKMTKLSELLSKINSEGYSEGLKQFLKNNLEYEFRFNKMEGNVSFRGIHKKNDRCLVVNSDLGNIPESISQSFNKVYSFETNKDKISIQKLRFKEKNIINIKLIHSDINSFTFQKNYFDLIIINGIKLNGKQKINNKINLLEYFSEIKQILTSDGCLCVCVNNKYGLKIFGKEVNEDEMFSSGFYGYNSLFNSLGLKIKSYWVLPSHKKPHHSGRIDDDISLKWFFNNFSKVFSIERKLKIVNLFLKRFNRISRKLIVKLFFPSFIFYCYKNDIQENIEDLIINETGFKNIVQNVRLTKILYFLLNEFGNPEKIISCKITKYNLTEKIFPIKRIFPKMKNPNEKIVIEDWLTGQACNRLDEKDIVLTLKWLMDFQNETKSEMINKQEISKEVSKIEKDLDKIEKVSCVPYNKWLKEYEEYINNLNLKKTGVHGDFQIRNILVDQKKSLVNIIDWDWRFQEKGNPTYDFIWFTINIMMNSNNPVKEFHSNLNGTGKTSHMIKIIQKTMKKHFGIELDFIILFRFMILRFITIKIKTDGIGYLLYIELLKILNTKNHKN